jgi:CMP-N,N'-diacetyllegionaminic acid synthase
MGLRILGVIPARGGSKGVPRKNVKLLAGKPLLQYTIDAALEATTLTRVVLSTDDEEIASLGRELGADAPFLRPDHLADDQAPMLGVVQHAVEALETVSDSPYDGVCLLQPTSPMRPAGLIDRCVALFEESGADAVITVLSVPHEHNPHWVFEPDADGWLRLATGEAQPIARRQDLPAAYHREGSVYVTRRAALDAGSLYGDRVLGVHIDPALSVNIDGPSDWTRAEQLLSARG